VPERLCRLAQRLLARHAKVVEQMCILGEIAQGGALPPPLGPAEPAALAGGLRS
jgi:hypothetical protein